MSVWLSRFQVIVELSCHSILVELFIIITVHYKFTIHVLRYWKTTRTNLLDLLFPVNQQMEQWYNSYGTCENWTGYNLNFHFRQELKNYLFKQRENTCFSKIIIQITEIWRIVHVPLIYTLVYSKWREDYERPFMIK